MRYNNVQEVNDTICGAGLILMTIITVPALIASLVRIPTVGWQPIMGVHIISVSIVVYLTIFRQRFGYYLKAVAVVAIIFIVGAAELLNFGIIGAGGAYLAYSAVVAAVLLGRNHSIIIFTISSLFMLLVYSAYRYDLVGVGYVDIIPYSKDPTAWGNFFFDYLLIWASIIAAFFYIKSALLTSLEELDKHSQVLETKVAERTSELLEEIRLKEAALVAERQAVKNNLNFVDMISHEYRTPLSVIMSSLDILKSDLNVQDHAETKKVVDRISVSSGRLLGLFELSLNERRIKDSNIVLAPKETDFIDNVINVAADFTRNIYPDHHIVIDDSRWTDPSLTVDRELMITAISNLLDNSCKYSEPSLVKITLTHDENFVVVEISDSGKGIPERDIDYIFEKYYRSESTGNRPGAGVGLYLTRKIVELHHGSIDIFSRQNKGTKIIVSLPVG